MKSYKIKKVVILVKILIKFITLKHALVNVLQFINALQIKIIISKLVNVSAPKKIAQKDGYKIHFVTV
jgi:hypothetical protein